jgi:hypothetical protein
MEAGRLASVNAYKLSCDGIRTHNALGKAVSASDFRKRVRAGSVVLVASDDTQIDPVYLRLIKRLFSLG